MHELLAPVVYVLAKAKTEDPEIETYVFCIREKLFFIPEMRQRIELGGEVGRKRRTEGDALRTFSEIFPLSSIFTNSF
jgi:hypothetical protein